MIVSLNLSQQQVTDATKLATTTEAKQQIQGLQALNYGVYRIFMDLTNPALFQSLRVVRTQGGSAVSLSSAAQSALQKALAGVGQIDVSYPVKSPQSAPLLVPTLFSLSTTQDTAQAPFSRFG